MRGLDDVCSLDCITQCHRLELQLRAGQVPSPQYRRWSPAYVPLFEGALYSHRLHASSRCHRPSESDQPHLIELGQLWLNMMREDELASILAAGHRRRS